MLVVLGLLLPLSAVAQKGDQYILPKFGQMSIDINDADGLNSFGILYGYGLSRHFSLEGEFNAGFSGGQYKKKDTLGNITETGEYRVYTLAAYTVVRKSLWDTAYIKGKMGVLFESVERASDTNQTLSDESFGFVGGISAELFLFDRLTWEMEATQIDRNIVFYSLGLHLKF